MCIKFGRQFSMEKKTCFDVILEFEVAWCEYWSEKLSHFSCRNVVWWEFNDVYCVVGATTAERVEIGEPSCVLPPRSRRLGSAKAAVGRWDLALMWVSIISETHCISSVIWKDECLLPVRSFEQLTGLVTRFGFISLGSLTVLRLLCVC